MPQDKPKNYVTLSRQLRQHWLWKDRPFSKGQAWIDLIFRANFADGKLLNRGREIAVNRGQAYISYSGLAEAWGWDRRKVKRFLQQLEECSMVSCTAGGTGNGTLLTLVKYSVFQLGGTGNGTSGGTDHGHEMDTGRYTGWPADGTAETLDLLDSVSDDGTADGTAGGTARGTGRGTHLRRTKKEIERGADAPHSPASFIPPTLDEVTAFCDEHGTKVDAETFFYFYEGNGWMRKDGQPVKNWKAQLCLWEKREKGETTDDNWY